MSRPVRGLRLSPRFALRLPLRTCHARISSRPKVCREAGEVRGAIESQNMQAAAGTVGNEFSNDWMSFKVNVKGRLRTKAEFENIVVRDDAATGSQVLLKDVARVERVREALTGRRGPKCGQ